MLAGRLSLLTTFTGFSRLAATISAFIGTRPQTKWHQQRPSSLRSRYILYRRPEVVSARETPRERLLPVYEVDRFSSATSAEIMSLLAVTNVDCDINGE